MRLRSDPVVRLRALVLAAYCVNGFCLSAWNVRLAAIGEQTGLDAAGLGRFLMAGAIGTLVTIPVAGRWVARAGSRRVYGLATVGFVVAYLALAAAIALGAVWPLLAANALHGAAFALTNVPQSVLGTQAERRVGRSILSQFHAAYSIAAALGAALGGLAATAGLGPAPQLLALAVLAGAARTAVWSGLRGAGTLDPLPARPVPPSGPDEEPTPRGRRTGVWLETSTLLLGTVVFGAALSEGAANNWITPTLIDAFPVDEGTAATAVSVFLVAQTLGRIAGGRLVDRFGATVALVTSGLVSTAGVVLFAAAPVLWLCWVGAGVWGLGAALSVPVAISVAARGGDAPTRIAAVTSLSSLANIAGPPLIGAAADAVGLRWAVGAVGVVLLAGAVAGRFAARDRRPRIAPVRAEPQPVDAAG
ncbi:MFS transporter [Cellulomonas soli]|uniref:MFS transporter n=1 Tax=Cellulomonas soli TaxID=931535 RepID=A0A512PF77_9CELL|nr:MFS transporter [Cellulomonas soli]NYI59352.1 putative MFS family arabinose efflux permease [Cellulomonas soli]GEP69860.1 MFS transporter [Cellulomonas soli]